MKFSALPLTLLLLAPWTTLHAEKPNILFIFTDDQSHRTVSCYPEAWDFVHTPNIDALAEKGVRFSQAYTGTWCMASRATLLTGHHQTSIESMRMEGPYPGCVYDPEACPFWPRVFREQGYQTAHIGKWHTGTDTGFGRDWDYQIVWNRPNLESRPGNYYYDQGISFQGGDIEIVSGYSTDNYTKWALEYLRGEGRDAEKPWYLWLCYGAVHGPFTPADRHLDALPDVDVPTPADIFPPRAGKPDYLQGPGSWLRGEDGEPIFRGKKRATGEVTAREGIHGPTLSDWVRQYHQSVLAIDEAVGQLVDTLKETGQYENTLIVFTSDQGFAWGQHGFRTKVAGYDATIRCPLIISMPDKVAAGVVRDVPIGGIDLVPTFFDFAGIDLPWKMHGRTLRPLLESNSEDVEANWNRQLLTVFTGRHYGSDTDTVPTDQSVMRISAGVPWYLTLHDGRYKYIRNLEEGEIEELYDLQADPDELTNLALDAAHRDRVSVMREATVAELRSTEAPLADNLLDVAALPEK